MVIETLLIAPMAAFDFTVMSRRPRPDALVVYA